MKDNPWAQHEEKIEGQIPSATLEIYKYIERYLEREKDNNVNRASAASNCVKRRWYQHHGQEATPLTPRKMVNFMLGDLTERTLQYFIKEALVGNGKLYSEVDFGEHIGTIKFQGRDIDLYSQKTLSFKLLDGTTITGHADGFGRRNSDGMWELIEIKSAADYGYNDFLTKGPGDYINQAHALMMTEECTRKSVNQVRFFYLKKNTGHIYDRLYDYNEDIAIKVIEAFIAAKGDIEPKAPYSLFNETFRSKPTGRVIAAYPCTYCPYLEKCQGPHTKEFKNGSPKFVFKGETK